MKTSTIVEHINMACDRCDFVTARTYIERSINQLTTSSYYKHLNKNARDLLAFIVTEQSNTKRPPLSRLEIGIIQALNRYATDFDVHGLKRTVKDHPELLQRTEAQQLMNADAKFILVDMGAIQPKTEEEQGITDSLDSKKQDSEFKSE